MAELQELVGYAVFDRFEECFEYIENGCFVASTIESANDLLRQCMGNATDYEIREVYFEGFSRGLWRIVRGLCNGTNSSAPL